jgi:preprotein translocase subunit SecY
MFNMFSGGALSRFTIFALGIMPYISASIIMQLMTVVVVPSLEALKKEGEAGSPQDHAVHPLRHGRCSRCFRRWASRSRWRRRPGWCSIRADVPLRDTVVTLVTGTMFLMWLGEQITERGLGNGISIIIFAGIAAGLPSAIGGLLELVRTGAMHPLTALFICAWWCW